MSNETFIEEQTAAYAEFHHQGQKYGDQDYFGAHILKVVQSLKSSGASLLAIQVGYLHDVVEDTEVTIDEICGVFALEVAEAVDAITKREGESRNEYLKRCLKNPVARFVKLHDAWCNLNQSVASADAKRIRKYSNTVQCMLRGVA